MKKNVNLKNKICEGCNEIVRRSERLAHNCYSKINQKIQYLEEIVKDTADKLEQPLEKSECEESKGSLCVRHEYIQDYSLEFSIYHQENNHYQISLPAENLPMSKEAR